MVKEWPPLKIALVIAAPMLIVAGLVTGMTLLALAGIAVAAIALGG